MKTVPATLLCDFYKISHRPQYPFNTQKVYATWTPRMSRISKINGVISFGFQAFIQKYLIDFFNENFFSRPEMEVVCEYRRIIKYALGDADPDTSHISALHQLGYLPVEIRAVEEGKRVPIRVPMMTIHNTLPEFFWLTNYLETIMSAELWLPMTSATIANKYRGILNKAARLTTGSIDGVEYQGHDFSMRGMASLEAAMSSGAGHLLSFVGTDTIPAIIYLEQYYGANVETECVGTSIPATEHSVMCAHGRDELASYTRLIKEVYPKGLLSIVSDTWDLWEVLTKVIAPLKKDILARDGKIVIRPDSGDPVDIVCGNPNGATEEERKGVVEILWDIFGGTVTEQGYKVLDPHIGCIYGDAITPERCEQICGRLAKKGFTSTNMVFGIGSFTYQYNTRDTFGFALKSTLAVVNSEERHIYKDPKTDDGTKKSQRGGVGVHQRDDNNLIECVDGLSFEEATKYEGNLLTPIFKDGKALTFYSLKEIRERVLNDM